MNLQERIELLTELGIFLEKNEPEWQDAKIRAHQQNPWFTHAFTDIATENIVQNFLQKDKLQHWAKHYHLDDNIVPKNTGIVMAGNIPMVGFHDFLAAFISGHRQTIKLSSKDDVLLPFLINKLSGWNGNVQKSVIISEMLKGCDAYIATGSNNSARYFEQYFEKYPHIIRRNKTSVAILTGNESITELEKLAADIHLYFGMGCRNVTKLWVPQGYDFVPLLGTFNRYSYFMDQHKYKNNYDYQLSIMLLNNIFYMTNGSTLLIENPAIFSPISVLHYEFYEAGRQVPGIAENASDIQCIVGQENTPFGTAQSPGLFSYADGVDTMQFLLTL